MEIKQLTNAEEQVMQIVWQLKETVVKDVVEQFDEPKPAYTTVATVLTVLEKKGFVEKRKIGNTNLFIPAISKAEYTKLQFTSLLKNYFSGSFPKMATFFARENQLNIEDLESIMKQAEEELKKEQPKTDS
ncbi:transcriptional regulator [Prolixibacter bellariivorans]|uniref:Transcriptional regulator n=1 Tax=Prolixibacter bellariivorans TaxID=314319 RepID=A0A5M4AZB4_9BACT|nr:BlaI/MecI/CopY family transcriptional regulator [Prolixibacter bellariivorans]GET33124.1 transcriptional regulator [Prolixibacter bellariivorans]